MAQQTLDAAINELARHTSEPAERTLAARDSAYASLMLQPVTRRDHTPHLERIASGKVPTSLMAKRPRNQSDGVLTVG